MELDHIFICVNKDAVEAELLTSLGLIEGSRNIHPGQGTANRRFFFHNVMLELLWLENSNEAQSPLTQPTGLFERCSLNSEQASPFGFCFRPTLLSESQAPFPSWQYQPQFFPPPLCVEVAKAPFSEPMWFYLSFLSRTVPEKSKEPINHDMPLNYLTQANFFMPVNNQASEAVGVINELDDFSIHHSDDQFLELEFDQGKAHKQHDFRPALPLVLKW